MGFFDKLFGNTKAAPSDSEDNQHKDTREMKGVELSISQNLDDYFIGDSIRNQHLTEKNYDKLVYTDRKFVLFLEKFSDEKFVFDRPLKYIFVSQFIVDKNMRGRVLLKLFSKSYDEIAQHSRDFGEVPDKDGWLYLVFDNGKPYVMVTRYAESKGDNTLIWANVDWKNQRSIFDKYTYPGDFDD